MPSPFPYRAVLFDLDGTLYRGVEAIPGAVATDFALRERGVLVRYVTNNATLTRAAFAAKLNAMGFPARLEEIASSASGTTVHLVATKTKRVYAIGMPGLVQTLREAGISVVNADADGIVGTTGEPADAVVVGMCKGFDYALLEGAMNQIAAGARFVATNPDATFPLEGGRFCPGAGSLVAAVETCSGVSPFVVGKPRPFLIETLLAEADLSPDQALVVGDRLDTDIAAGTAAGCPTFLVLTGVAKAIPPGQWGGESVECLVKGVG